MLNITCTHDWSKNSPDCVCFKGSQVTFAKQIAQFSADNLTTEQIFLCFKFNLMNELHQRKQLEGLNSK